MPDPTWKIVGVDDYSSDGKPDLPWRNVASGEIYVWFMNGAVRVDGKSLIMVSDLDWQIVPRTY